jgi:hypothetical protein
MFVNALLWTSGLLACLLLGICSQVIAALGRWIKVNVSDKWASGIVRTTWNDAVVILRGEALTLVNIERQGAWPSVQTTASSDAAPQPKPSTERCIPVARTLACSFTFLRAPRDHGPKLPPKCVLLFHLDPLDQGRTIGEKSQAARTKALTPAVQPSTSPTL